MKAQENFESKTISHEIVAFQNSNRSSNRNFGLVFSVVFLLFALFLLWEKSDYFAISALLALVFCVIAFVRPILLAPLNGAWFYFGNLLHRFVSPIIMGGIFFLFFVPIGALMKFIFRYDPLRLKETSKLDSYWVSRDQPFKSNSFRDQF